MEETSRGNPWRIGWEAAKANFIPALTLQIAAAALVAGYYLWPAVSGLLDPLARWQARNGWRSAFLSRAFFGGLLPALFFISIPSLRPKRIFAAALSGILWWGGMGIAVFLLYRWQSILFGDGRDALTLLNKTLLDQFLYTPFFAVPLNGLFNFWIGCGLSFRAVRETLTPGRLRRLILTNLIPNWAVWFPGMFLIYSLPEPLQVHVSGLVGCFWALMCLQIGSRISAPRAS